MKTKLFLLLAAAIAPLAAQEAAPLRPLSAGQLVVKPVKVAAAKRNNVNVMIGCFEVINPQGDYGNSTLVFNREGEIIGWPNACSGSVEDYIVRTNLHQNYVRMVTTNKAVGAGTMIAAWPNHIIQHLTEAKESYIIAELDLASLRQARIHSREFRQRRPAMYRELARNLPVAAYYGVDSTALEVPSPSPEAKAAVLQHSGIASGP